MSKIYEALLRAELERLGKSAPDTGSAVEPEVTLARLQAAAAAAEQATAETPAHAFPWERIARVPWNVSTEQLPAMLKVAVGAEQFRSLRARMYEYRDFNKLKSILICSGMPQEGKSFVAANLAVSLAQQRSGKVLLIDGDLRRFTLNKILGTRSEPGISEYLMGKADAFDVMQQPDLERFSDPKTADALQNLVFIPAGHGGEQVVDLNTSERFHELLALAAPAFEWIVVDSSPVNLVSDAVHYARDCDGVLLVVRSGVTRYELAQRAAAEFKTGSVLGVVLNGSTEAPRAGYYGYEYSGESR